MSEQVNEKVDTAKVEPMTPKVASQVLSTCEISSRFLYSTLYDIAESPKRKHKSFDNDTLREAVPAWQDVFRTAWQAVDVLAEKMDNGESPANRWSVKTKVAVKRLYNSLRFGNLVFMPDPTIFIRRLRRNPELMLPMLASRIADFDALVTTMEIVLSPSNASLHPRELLSQRDDKNIGTIKDAFHKHPGKRLPFSKVVSGSGLNKETIQRLLPTMIAKSEVKHHGKRGGYSLLT
jgi:hypothetical protein